MPLAVYKPIYCIDFEGSKRTSIIEHGIVCIENGLIECTQTELFSSAAPITAKESTIHSLTSSQLPITYTFSTQWEVFAQMRLTGVFAAHSAPTEDWLLKSVWPYGPATQDFMHPERLCHTWGPWIDTHKLYASLFPQLETHTLSSLIQTFSLQAQLDVFAQQQCPKNRRRYHCALYDALGSALLLMHLGTLFPRVDLTLSWLLTNSCSSLKKRQTMRQMEL